MHFSEEFWLKLKKAFWIEFLEILLKDYLEEIRRKKTSVRILEVIRVIIVNSWQQIILNRISRSSGRILEAILGMMNFLNWRIFNIPGKKIRKSYRKEILKDSYKLVSFQRNLEIYSGSGGVEKDLKTSFRGDPAETAGRSPGWHASTCVVWDSSRKWISPHVPNTQFTHFDVSDRSDCRRM